MNQEGYDALNEIVDEFELRVEPEPPEGHSVTCFDIVSDTTEIPAAKVVNAIYAAAKHPEFPVDPDFITAQSHRLTFQDLNVH